MTKIKALIQKNNQLRLALNTENRQFYNDLLLYMRCQSITRNEEIVEKQLLVILEDIWTRNKITLVLKLIWKKCQNDC